MLSTQSHIPGVRMRIAQSPGAIDCRQYNIIVPFPDPTLKGLRWEWDYINQSGGVVKSDHNSNQESER